MQSLISNGCVKNIIDKEEYKVYKLHPRNGSTYGKMS
jgi:hypothetical protein